MDFASFLIQTLNSLQYGLLLFLVASGLTLVFGIMGIINLAHGSFYMIGAYLAFVLTSATGSLVLAVVLTFISFALINNTIRLAIYSKRFLIHTMKLVGASWSFIRRPFLLRNMWIGILAATMADAVLIGLAYMLVHYEPDLLAVVTPGVMVVVMGAVFVFGVLITSLCALISINKYLRMKVSELYYI